MKLYDSELKIMDVLWRRGDAPAREIASELKQTVGWNVNTTYTLIKRCLAKGALARMEPGFLCHALVSRETVQQEETQELIDRMFDGSADTLFASLLTDRRVSPDTLRRLRNMIDEMDDEG